MFFVMVMCFLLRLPYPHAVGLKLQGNASVWLGKMQLVPMASHFRKLHLRHSKGAHSCSAMHCLFLLLSLALSSVRQIYFYGSYYLNALLLLHPPKITFAKLTAVIEGTLIYSAWKTCSLQLLISARIESPKQAYTACVQPTLLLLLQCHWLINAFWKALAK